MSDTSGDEEVMIFTLVLLAEAEEKSVNCYYLYQIMVLFILIII